MNLPVSPRVINTVTTSLGCYVPTLVPIYNENGDYYMYDDLNKAGWFNYNSYTSNPIAAMVKLLPWKQQEQKTTD